MRFIRRSPDPVLTRSNVRGLEDLKCRRAKRLSESLAGNGGSGYALSPRMFDAIDLRQTGGKPRVVLDAEDYEGFLARIRELEAEGALLSPGAVS